MVIPPRRVTRRQRPAAPPAAVRDWRTSSRSPRAESQSALVISGLKRLGSGASHPNLRDQLSNRPDDDALRLRCCALTIPAATTSHTRPSRSSRTFSNPLYPLELRGSAILCHQSRSRHLPLTRDSDPALTAGVRRVFEHECEHNRLDALALWLTLRTHAVTRNGL